MSRVHSRSSGPARTTVARRWTTTRSPKAHLGRRVVDEDLVAGADLDALELDIGVQAVEACARCRRCRAPRPCGGRSAMARSWCSLPGGQQPGEGLRRWSGRRRRARSAGRSAGPPARGRPSAQRVRRNGGSVPTSCCLPLAREAAQHAADEAVGAGRDRTSITRRRRRLVDRDRRRRRGPRSAARRLSTGGRRRRSASRADAGRPAPTAGQRRARRPTRRRGAEQRAARETDGRARSVAHRPSLRQAAAAAGAAPASPAVAGCSAAARAGCVGRGRQGAGQDGGDPRRRRARPRSIGSGLLQPPWPGVRPQDAGRRPVARRP